MNTTLQESMTLEMAQEDSPEDSILEQAISIKSLLKFSAPTIGTMTIMGVMGTVDGIFASRFIGPEALAVINMVWPFLLIAMAASFMLGTGGNAFISKQLGQGKTKEARSNFTLIIVAAFGLSTALSLVGFIFPTQLMRLLGANGTLVEAGITYMTPLLWTMPPLVLGFLFQQFLVTEGKAHIGMYASIAGAIVNIVLNWLFIGVLGFGLAGAAWATGLNYVIPGVVGFIYFVRNRNGMLYLSRFKWCWSVLWRSSINGVSEMITMGAGALAITIINNVLMNISSPLAVAAFGIIWVTQGLLSTAFMGYATGIIPLISYNYGKRDTGKLKKIFRKSIYIVSVWAVASVGVGFLLIRPILWVFDIPNYSPVFEMTQTGFRFFVIGFLFIGVNMFATMMFTALNNALVSGLLSLCRTLIFVVASIFTLSQLFGLTGVWLALPVAELLSLLLSIFFFMKMRGKYQYI